MFSANEKLVELLNEASKAFMAHDLQAISCLLREDFQFKMYFERDGKKFLLKGDLEKYLSGYKNIAKSENRYIYWNYEVLNLSRTIFGKTKATLLFRCIVEGPDHSKKEYTNLEKIVCVMENGKAKLQKLETNFGNEHFE